MAQRPTQESRYPGAKPEDSKLFKHWSEAAEKLLDSGCYLVVGLPGSPTSLSHGIIHADPDGLLHNSPCTGLSIGRCFLDLLVDRERCITSIHSIKSILLKTPRKEPWYSWYKTVRDCPSRALQLGAYADHCPELHSMRDGTWETEAKANVQERMKAFETKQQYAPHFERRVRKETSVSVIPTSVSVSGLWSGEQGQKLREGLGRGAAQEILERVLVPLTQGLILQTGAEALARHCDGKAFEGLVAVVAGELGPYLPLPNVLKGPKMQRVFEELQIEGRARLSRWAWHKIEPALTGGVTGTIVGILQQYSGE